MISIEDDRCQLPSAISAHFCPPPVKLEHKHRRPADALRFSMYWNFELKQSSMLLTSRFILPLICHRMKNTDSLRTRLSDLFLKWYVGMAAELITGNHYLIINSSTTGSHQLPQYTFQSRYNSWLTCIFRQPPRL